MKHPKSNNQISKLDVGNLCRSVDQPTPKGFADKVLAKAKDRQQVRRQKKDRQREQDRER